MAYLVANKKRVPQSQPLNSRQVKNNAGGYVYKIDPWRQLDRFLILGCEGPTYYAGQQAQLDVADAMLADLVAKDGKRLVATVSEMSESGRAPKQDTLLYALATAASIGDEATKREAYAALPRVARIGTHLLHWVAMCKAKRGTGSGFRRAVNRWYAGKSDSDLVYGVMKYQQRDGWSQRDVLRLTHPAATGRRNDIFHWVAQGWPDIGDAPHGDDVLARIWAFERMKRTTDAAEACRLIREYDLPRECVRTEFLSDASVWGALLERMPLTAMIRNLGNMSKVGLLTDLSDASRAVCGALCNEDALRKAHVHPIQLLSALMTYANGHGARGSGEWRPVAAVAGALELAITRSFDYLPPTGKRFYVGVDVSGSMSHGDIAGVPGLSPAVASACMALAIAKAERPNYVVRGFTSKLSYSPLYARSAHPTGLTPLGINDGSTFRDAVGAVAGKNFGATDCALPMLDAMGAGLGVDVFVVITDNETWHGTVHPMEALRQYRMKMGINAKLAVIGMTSTGFSIADPKDGGCLDMVGFDAAAPRILADFACNGA